MSSNNSLPNCSCWNCVEARKRQKRDLIDFAKTGAPPALDVPQRLEPAEIDLALRQREDAFNEDVIPTTVLPPRELYGKAMWPRALPRMQEQPTWGGEPVSMSMFATRADFELARRRPASMRDFALDFHASNERWWRDLVTGERLDRNMGEMLMLVISEIAECMEGERKDLMDDHLPHRKMAEVELADAVIRIADIVGSFGREDAQRFEARLKDIESNDLVVPDNKGEALKRICDAIGAIYGTNHQSRRTYTINKLARAFHRIERYADKHGYDLWGAVFEKMEYNNHRADHKPEARLAAGGKKF